MRKSDFNYSLPPELVAQYPASPRTASRLLHLDGASGVIRDLRFTDLPSLLQAGDLLVFNDTRVIPARLFGNKNSGGRIEVLIERFHDAQRALAQIRSSKPPKPGQKLLLEGDVSAVVQGRAGEFYEIVFDTELPAMEILDRIGHVPLPPYIDRADESADRERYQTVYARHRGAVAAPTAGLHFDEAMLKRLSEMGVESAFVTLHVGAGTFQPLRVNDVREHRMHAEYLSVPPSACDKIREYLSVPPSACDKISAAKKENRRVVAVGTTVVRALETAAQGRANVAGGRTPGVTAARDGRVKPFEGETDIFIYPGYRFRIVDALLTNFHLPESTLLMLVCAFGGTEQVLGAYRHAVEQKYRFYSYGDAMFVAR
ncbi:MAG: tRNA preQ1(34) S-adenosylmethionine ribosyltransferase-isomerase QueA [Gammaproteobacteria bacterium]|nr:tRNA preQ1(34) S-adenosylmethionine ribosyltransferase-isomerase QueA [Gammaproteobacteria bacterium]